MSYSKTIVVHNTDVFIESANQARSALGLKPLPSGISISKAEKTMQTALLELLGTTWKQDHSSTSLPAENQDTGYMYPASALEPGSAPSCVKEQIQSDFTNWGIPWTDTVIDRMANQITLELVEQGGEGGTFGGSTALNSNESVDWVVGYAKLAFSNPQNGEAMEGFLFGFVAAVAVSF